jgi:hypothetical protein
MMQFTESNKFAKSNLLIQIQEFFYKVILFALY